MDPMREEDGPSVDNTDRLADTLRDGTVIACNRSSPTEPKVTAAVLNYNGRGLLETILPSLAAQVGVRLKIVVVDNGSTDDSLAWLAEHWPAVAVVSLTHNIGVTAALNICLDACQDQYAALLNNDVELDATCIAQLVDALENHPEAGSSAPKMLDFTDRRIIDGAGDMLSWRGGGRRRGHGELDVGQYDRPQEVFGPCGGAAMYRRIALDDVGGFDESYFAYYEDIDWAFRAQLAGYRCRYVPSAVVYHRGSATLGRGFNNFNGYHLWRNPVWLIAKCFPARSLLRHSHQIARGQAGNAWTAVRTGKLGIWKRAMLDATAGLPSALRKRRELQASRVIPTSQLEEFSTDRRADLQPARARLGGFMR